MIENCNISREKIPNWLLILQGWAILWIVIGNSALGVPGNGPDWENSLLRTAYSFHFALLMFVGGCIFYRLHIQTYCGKKSYLFLARKLISLLLTFVFFTIAVIIVKMLFFGIPSFNWGVCLIETKKALLYPGDKPLSQIWFLAVLSIYMALLPIWNYVLKRHWLSCFFLILLFLFHLFRPTIDFLCIGWIFYFVLYFYGGLFINKWVNLENMDIQAIMVVLLIGYVVYLYGLDFDKMLSEIGGISFSVSISLLLNKYYPLFFRGFRYYFYQIFLLGFFFQLIIKMVRPQQFLPYPFAYLLCVAIGLYCPVLLTIFLKKLKNSMLNA